MSENKKGLNGWHGAAVACAVFGLVLCGLSLSGALTPKPEAVAEAKAEQLRTENKGVMVGKTKADATIERFYDEEAGIYVYVLDGYRAMAVAPATGRVEKSQ